jgi:hypothetical protein
MPQEDSDEGVDPFDLSNLGTPTEKKELDQFKPMSSSDSDEDGFEALNR